MYTIVNPRQDFMAHVSFLSCVLLHQVIRLVLQNLTEHSWLIQMAATRALQLQQPAESREAASQVLVDQNPASQVSQVQMNRRAFGLDPHLW